MGDPVGSTAQQAERGVFDQTAHARHRRERPTVKAHDERLANEEIELREGDATRRRGVVDSLYDDEEVAVVDLHLRRIEEIVEAVVDGQVVEPEDVAQERLALGAHDVFEVDPDAAFARGHRLRELVRGEVAA